MTELLETQLIRVVDVLLLGPIMVWAGAKVTKRSEVAGAFLFVSGLSTIVFNGVNFVRRAKCLLKGL